MSKQFRIAVGLVMLALVVVLLTTSSGMFFSRGILLIDTEISSASGQGSYVKTTMDFGDAEKMESILLDSTEWSGFPYDMSNVEQQLNADVLTAWGCRHASSLSIIWFLIVQSRDVVSFHPPPVCYQALGYEIEEEEIIAVELSGTGWAVAEWTEAMRDPNLYTGTINVKKLVVTKGDGDTITEKRVVLYYYLKDKGASMPNEITMIRVSALAPIQGSYDNVLEMEKKIIADFFPLMFEPRSEERTLYEWLIDEGGALGGFAIAAMIMIPLGFMFYPVVMKKRISRMSRTEVSSE